MKKLLAILSLLLILCSFNGKKNQGYQIGLDPTWYPLELTGREKNVLAFSVELLQEIAKKENLQFSIVSMNWNNLLWGLTEKKYDAILSSLYPYIFYKKKFAFSDLFLATGPVIVIPISSKIKELNDLKGRAVGIIQGSPSALLLQKYPNIILRSYESIPETLNALTEGHIEAAALEILPVQSYVRDLYGDKLKIATAPLTDQGLRLISLKGKNQKLIDKFDAGLRDLKKSKRYAELLNKWGLSPDSTPISDLQSEMDLLFKQHAL